MDSGLGSAPVRSRPKTSTSAAAAPRPSSTSISPARTAPPTGSRSASCRCDSACATSRSRARGRARRRCTPPRRQRRPRAGRRRSGPSGTRLTRDQAHQDDPHLWERAERLGLDLDRFERDRRSEQIAARVQADFRERDPRRGDRHPERFRGRRARPRRDRPCTDGAFPLLTAICKLRGQPAEKSEAQRPLIGRETVSRARRERPHGRKTKYL